MNKDIYKDEFGIYHEVEEEEKTSVDGEEDDEQDHYEDADDSFDVAEDEDLDEDLDEDEAYLNERRSDYDVDED